jgi:acetyl-CoA acetyltransferase
MSDHLPEPRLTRVFRLEATLGEPLDLGDTPQGHRRIVPLTGGRFTGPKLNGRLLPGASADWQIVLPDGTVLGDIRYTLRTDAEDLLYVRSRGVRLARVVASAVHALDPQVMGIAPAFAIPKALERAGLVPGDIDVWEVHEAYASVAVAILRELPKQLDGFEVPDDRLNPNGGAVAIGHPFGSSGTRYVLTLATELRERGARYGVLGVCVGSGQGVALVLENVS